MNYLGHTYTKYLFVVYLILKFNWEYCKLFAKFGNLVFIIIFDNITVLSDF